MSWLLLCMVIFVTFAALMLGVGWIHERGNRALDKIRMLDLLDQATANVQLSRAGRLPVAPGDAMLRTATSNTVFHSDDLRFRALTDPGAPFAGASQTGQPVPWDLAGAAYALGQQRADQDAVSREVNAIFAEIEGNPAKWRHG